MYGFLSLGKFAHLLFIERRAVKYGGPVQERHWQLSLYISPVSGGKRKPKIERLGP